MLTSAGATAGNIQSVESGRTWTKAQLAASSWRHRSLQCRLRSRRPLPTAPNMIGRLRSVRACCGL
ncbi:hypothetical protein C8T65DRAFT_657681 [Cerioporus squamosus]|nr:hypothetical protein C8T65DRAFT_657681 [Cerioporus squamosus]